ncbi:MAG: biotin/lipoyl-binding protein [Flavobacteriales bacterium]|nr:biotin/lipoyl-binding protein [Flavobacteriales bacterium]
MNINSVLIANRGEIAVRIIRTCQSMGIRAIAVYSEADRYSPHVALSDEAVLIGPAESAQSYLNAEAIIAAAQRTGADAIHPGYGFLSESEVLIAACEREGITFIGPHREAIRLMGSKIESKTLAQQASVATIPGYHGADQSETALVAAAKDIGFPLMIKASAGGGGRGMRRIDNTEQLIAELPQAKQEALSGFGDDSVLLEKLITSPRHIEVQLAADKQGNIVHLFERECSIQRNHQKVIEEAPAAFLEEAQRAQLFKDAIILGKTIAYDSLGTVEFLLDNDTGETYFLEMNTRLQVEHPVTEAITGFDLVEWQIRIAAGESLPVSQEQITATGWAIEARVNAEDPANDYRPETGTLSLYREPRDTDGDIRVDSGICQGSAITPYYDPMLAKVIGSGADREQARQALLRGLADFTLIGVGTNLEFLSSILRHNNFVASPLTTNYLGETFGGDWQKNPSDDTLLVCAAVAKVMMLEQQAGEPQTNQRLSTNHISPWQSLGGFRVLARSGQIGKTRINLITPEGDIETVILSGCNGDYQTQIIAHQDIDQEDSKHTVCAGWLGEQILQVEVDGLSRHLAVDCLEDEIILKWAGQSYCYQQLNEQQLALSDASSEGSGELKVIATLPGLVTEIKVSVGDQVTMGDTLVVLDSMKLLHNLNAQTDGTVAEIFCTEGDNVEGGAVLIELVAEESAD